MLDASLAGQSPLRKHRFFCRGDWLARLALRWEYELGGLEWTTGKDYWTTGMDYWTTGLEYWIGSPL